ncbi:hypothetical protein [Streptomyces rubradiris]|uniref:Uncharacterized protein n=1 Tax=Streptomyces rubradiris TaxID=285531 RepID=A0ABQ3R3D6_STRRR|nr:hypothetical protein [Streptomyces rubradiris]GHH29969.1 hypothetical protein GCM10018792_75770 [Streptomyces rubradiris]GHI50358.1 hypothetical protein Srubr_02040 [Streptomyces rubradiris]
MSTEVATRDEQQTVAQQQAPQPEPTAGTTALVAWAQEASLAYDMATKLAATSFVPASLRGKPGDIAAAILAGSELGLKPMATLKSIDIIQGSPALRAHAMRGLVQAHGHKIQLVESTDTYCKMRGLRKDEDTWQEVEWDIPRAQRLGLLGKDQWKKQPRTMLVARATGEICRLIASDVLHGMPYVAEELGDFVHGELVPQKAPLSVAAITAPVPAPAPQQPDGEPEAIDVETDADAAADALWDDAPPAGSGNWPEVAQPGGQA